VVTVVIGAIAGLWRTVFGSRKERIDANERAAEIALKAAEHADERAERADDESAVHKRALGTCEEQLRAMGTRIDRLEREHSTCGPRIARLESEARLSRTMLADLMRNHSTPPSGLYVPEDVRAAMAQEDDHG
jgi:chromosome segregation ATPase